MEFSGGNGVDFIDCQRKLGSEFEKSRKWGLGVGQYIRVAMSILGMLCVLPAPGDSAIRLVILIATHLGVRCKAARG